MKQSSIWLILIEFFKLGHGNIMKILIKSGSNVNEKNHFGDTPLHLLALRRFPGKLKKKKSMIFNWNT